MGKYQRIGIIGGLSAESTAQYYLEITRAYVRRFGDCGYPEILILSLDLEPYHRWRDAGRWDLVAADLARAAETLREAGADFGLIATNTMHKVFEAVARTTGLPLLHILDPVIAAARGAGIRRLGLLGTRYTMQEDFGRERLASGGIETLVPPDREQAELHRIIVDELVKGQCLDPSRAAYRKAILRLAERGAQGIVLGCTEIPLLVRAEDSPLPLFDTAALHAGAALRRALGDAWNARPAAPALLEPR